MNTLKNWLALLLVSLALATPANAETASDCAPVPSAVPALQQAVHLLAPSPEGEATGGEELSELEALAAIPKLADAPAQISFPTVLTVGARYAMNNSFPGGRSQEHGGLLVKNADGSWEFKRGEAGQSAMWTQNYDDLEEGEVLVALLHTHPYDATEGGFTHVSFSGQDLAMLVASDEPITVVQSGPGMFAVAKSKEFDDWISRYSWSQRDSIYRQMVQHFEQTMQRAMNSGRSFPDAIDDAVVAVAKKYKLVYYKGEAGEALKRVDTSQ
jgi:hypothetical protein